jgi:hypothetical protein
VEKKRGERRERGERGEGKGRETELRLLAKDENVVDLGSSSGVKREADLDN